MRWIWIDRFLEFTSGKSARAVKNLSVTEDLFADHFPGYPVLPAALMLEGLAQTGGILVGEATAFQEKVVLAKIPRAHFTREVLAGEQVIYEVELLHLRPRAPRCSGACSPASPRRAGRRPWSARRKSSSPIWTGRARSSSLATRTSSSPVS